MKFSLFLFLIIVIAFITIPALGQETKPMAEEMPSMIPPKPLSGDFNNWMVGEWEGYSDSPMGKSKDWMKCDWALDKQFIVITYEGKFVEPNMEMMEGMAKQMNMSKEDMDKMAETPYKGMGLVSEDPQTGKMMGYWFDNWRGVSKGSGSQEKDTQTMTWEGSMGTEVRTIEMVGMDKMMITFKSSSPMGEFEGKSEYTRKGSSQGSGSK